MKVPSVLLVDGSPSTARLRKYAEENTQQTAGQTCDNERRTHQAKCWSLETLQQL